MRPLGFLERVGSPSLRSGTAHHTVRVRVGLAPESRALVLLFLVPREALLGFGGDVLAQGCMGAHPERLGVLGLPVAEAASRDFAVACRVSRESQSPGRGL